MIKSEKRIIPKQFKTKSKYYLKEIINHYQLYLILLLPIVYIVIFHYIPMYGVQIAFRKFIVTKGISESPFVGLRYFRQFFRSPSFEVVIKNTFMISVYSIIAGFPFPIILAISLNEVKNKVFVKSVQMVTYAPYFISTVVMVGLLYQVLDPNIGIVNSAIKMFGGEPKSFMSQSSYFRHVYVWSGIWQTMGYSAIIYLAALSGIDPQLQEAALIDGATRIKRIWHVDLPSISSTIVILFILSFGRIMSVGFEKVYLMQNPVNASKSEIIATYVYKIGLLNANFSFSTAVGLFQSIINLILVATVNIIAKRVSDYSLW